MKKSELKELIEESITSWTKKLKAAAASRDSLTQLEEEAIGFVPQLRDQITGALELLLPKVEDDVEISSLADSDLKGSTFGEIQSKLQELRDVEPRSKVFLEIFKELNTIFADATEFIYEKVDTLDRELDSRHRPAPISSSTGHTTVPYSSGAPGPSGASSAEDAEFSGESLDEDIRVLEGKVALYNGGDLRRGVPPKVLELFKEYAGQVNSSDSKKKVQARDYVKHVRKRPGWIRELDRKDESVYISKEDAEAEVIKVRGKALEIKEKLRGVDDIVDQLVETYIARIYDRMSDSKANQKIASVSPYQPICIDGPPGTGKTTIAKEIADMMGIGFVDYSMAGKDDKNFIYGRDFNWQHPEPGVVAEAQADSGRLQTMILYDEAEKASGLDLIQSFGQVLEKDQSYYKDECFGANIFKQDVFHVLTTNNFSALPEHIRSRVKKVYMGGYSNEVKKAILIGQIKKAISEEYERRGEISFCFPVLDIGGTAIGCKGFISPTDSTEDVLDYILENYVTEAGVREAKAYVDRVLEKAKVVALTDGMQLNVTTDLVRKALGEPPEGIRELKALEEKVNSGYVNFGKKQEIISAKEEEISKRGSKRGDFWGEFEKISDQELDSLLGIVNDYLEERTAMIENTKSLIAALEDRYRKTQEKTVQTRIEENKERLEGFKQIPLVVRAVLDKANPDSLSMGADGIADILKEDIRARQLQHQRQHDQHMAELKTLLAAKSKYEDGMGIGEYMSAVASEYGDKEVHDSVERYIARIKELQDKIDRGDGKLEDRGRLAAAIDNAKKHAGFKGSQELQSVVAKHEKRIRAEFGSIIGKLQRAGSEGGLEGVEQRIRQDHEEKVSALQRRLREAEARAKGHIPDGSSMSGSDSESPNASPKRRDKRRRSSSRDTVSPSASSIGSPSPGVDDDERGPGHSRRSRGERVVEEYGRGFGRKRRHSDSYTPGYRQTGDSGYEADEGFEVDISARKGYGGKSFSSRKSAEINYDLSEHVARRMNFVSSSASTYEVASVLGVVNTGKNGDVDNCWQDISAATIKFIDDAQSPDFESGNDWQKNAHEVFNGWESRQANRDAFTAVHKSGTGEDARIEYSKTGNKVRARATAESFDSPETADETIAHILETATRVYMETGNNTVKLNGIEDRPDLAVKFIHAAAILSAKEGIELKIKVSDEVKHKLSSGEAQSRLNEIKKSVGPRGEAVINDSIGIDDSHRSRPRQSRQ